MYNNRKNKFTNYLRDLYQYYNANNGKKTQTKIKRFKFIAYKAKLGVTHLTLFICILNNNQRSKEKLKK